jgi:hypothetical protein
MLSDTFKLDLTVLVIHIFQESISSIKKVRMLRHYKGNNFTKENPLGYKK